MLRYWEVVDGNGVIVAARLEDTKYVRDPTDPDFGDQLEDDEGFDDEDGDDDLFDDPDDPPEED